MPETPSGTSQPDRLSISGQRFVHAVTAMMCAVFWATASMGGAAEDSEDETKEMRR
jgi:hypothetical protein